MENDEKIVVSRYSARAYEDVPDGPEKAESSREWNSEAYPVDGGFGSAVDALKAVCKANMLEFRRDNWCSNFHSMPYAKNDLSTCEFTGCYLVNEWDREASEEDRKLWLCGEKKLFSLHMNVTLKVVSERDLTEEECAI